jgi:deoxyribonuclease-4
MKNNHQIFLIGAHMSIEGGLEKALERAQMVGSTTVQIFTKSNRQWFAKPLKQEEVEAFKGRAKGSHLQHITAHACYLINLASSTAETRKLSINALTEELERCDLLNIPYLVVHPGSHTGQGIENGIKCIAQGLDEAFEKMEII